MNFRRYLQITLAAAALSLASTAHAQSSATDYPWSVEFGIGWDNSISGNINSSGIGRINNQAVVILKNSYEDVYGTGLHVRFGGGYLIDEISEVRATFTFQSLDADLTPMGDIGVSRLYGQYQAYQSFGLDVGFRLYAKGLDSEVRPFVEATAGLAFIDETDVVLVAPTANLAGRATDFYDRTAAFTLGGNAGLLWQVKDRVFRPVDSVKADAWPAGVVYGTAVDQARWLMAAVNRGVYKGRRVLMESTFREMTRRQFDRFAGPINGGWLNETSGYGLAWWVSTLNGETIIAHSGSVNGYTAFLAGNLNPRTGVAILTNGNKAHRWLYGLAPKALAAL